MSVVLQDDVPAACCCCVLVSLSVIVQGTPLVGYTTRALSFSNSYPSAIVNVNVFNSKARVTLALIYTVIKIILAKLDDSTQLTIENSLPMQDR